MLCLTSSMLFSRRPFARCAAFRGRHRFFLGLTQNRSQIANQRVLTLIGRPIATTRACALGITSSEIDKSWKKKARSRAGQRGKRSARMVVCYAESSAAVRRAIRDRSRMLVGIECHEQKSSLASSTLGQRPRGRERNLVELSALSLVVLLLGAREALNVRDVGSALASTCCECQAFASRRRAATSPGVAIKRCLPPRWPRRTTRRGLTFPVPSGAGTKPLHRCGNLGQPPPDVSCRLPRSG